MIVHIVLFKFQEPVPENVGTAQAMLNALPAKIAEIKHFDVGVDVVRSARAYDLALYAKFESTDALQAYQIHPAHQEVVAFLNTSTSQVAVVDYEE